MASFKWDDSSKENMKKNMLAYQAKKKKHFAIAVAFWGDGTVAEMKEELIRLKAYDQGFLQAATTRTQPKWTGPKVSLTVYNPLEHATVIEWGRKPGKRPPLLPIIGWAKRKGIISHLPVNMDFHTYSDQWAASGAILRNMKKGGGKSKSNKPLDPIIHDLLIVRLIAQKIYEKGTKARHPFSRSWDRRAKVFLPEIRDVLQSLQ